MLNISKKIGFFSSDNPDQALVAHTIKAALRHHQGVCTDNPDAFFQHVGPGAEY